MMTDLEFSQLYNEAFKKSINEKVICFYPGCLNHSINSHIFQKNGILNKISKDNHIRQFEIDIFQDNYIKFKKKGINAAFSFKCFCNEHDNELFKKIENREVDYMDYESNLLFTIRTILNEIWRKEINLKIYNDFLIKTPELKNNNNFKTKIEQENLGLQDLKFYENEIWKDLINCSQSFVFEKREVSKIDICLSAFFNYETTNEMANHFNKTGKNMPRLSEIFINFFPTQKNNILLMGYHKSDEKKVKGYFYTFIKDKEKKLQTYLTNLLLFRCETWVVSEDFYENTIREVEDIFSIATEYSNQNIYERDLFLLNIFSPKFKTEFTNWANNYKF